MPQHTDRCQTHARPPLSFRARAALLASSLGTLVAAPVAAAVPPTTETEAFTRQFVVGQCEGTDILGTFNVTRRVTTFSDGSGTPIRRVAHAAIPGSLANTATGTTLPTTGVRTITTDLRTGTVKSTGTNVHVVVPGRGTLSIGAGLFIQNPDGTFVERGRQDEPLPPALCAALV